MCRKCVANATEALANPLPNCPWQEKVFETSALLNIIACQANEVSSTCWKAARFHGNCVSNSFYSEMLKLIVVYTLKKIQIAHYMFLEVIDRTNCHDQLIYSSAFIHTVDNACFILVCLVCPFLLHSQLAPWLVIPLIYQLKYLFLYGMSEGNLMLY